MRVGDGSDPGTHEGEILFVASHLERVYEDLKKLS
jgi:hypothetical protein